MLKRKGFTLIELLIVIAIIAVLLSILAPALQKAKIQAKYALCKSNQRILVIGVLLYAADNEDTFPPKISRPGYRYANVINYRPGDPSVDNNGGAMYPYLGRYLDNIKAFMCPLAPEKPDSYNDEYIHYDSIQGVETLVSYNMFWGGFEYPDAPYYFVGPKKVSSAGSHLNRRWYSRLLVSDVMTFWGWWSDAWWLSHPSENSVAEGEFYSLNDLLWWDYAAYIEVPEIPRMFGGYVDGHVEGYTSEQTMNMSSPSATSHLFYIPEDWK